MTNHTEYAIPATNCVMLFVKANDAKIFFEPHSEGGTSYDMWALLNDDWEYPYDAEPNDGGIIEEAMFRDGKFFIDQEILRFILNDDNFTFEDLVRVEVDDDAVKTGESLRTGEYRPVNGTCAAVVAMIKSNLDYGDMNHIDECLAEDQEQIRIITNEGEVCITISKSVANKPSGLDMLIPVKK